MKIIVSPERASTDYADFTDRKAKIAAKVSVCVLCVSVTLWCLLCANQFRAKKNHRGTETQRTHREPFSYEWHGDQ